MDLGLVLLATSLVNKKKRYNSIGQSVKDLLIKNKLISNDKTFKLTNLGYRFLVQARKDVDALNRTKNNDNNVNDFE